jgi:hypothetical protein
MRGGREGIAVPGTAAARFSSGDAPTWTKKASTHKLNSRIHTLPSIHRPVLPAPPPLCLYPLHVYRLSTPPATASLARARTRPSIRSAVFPRLSPSPRNPACLSIALYEPSVGSNSATGLSIALLSSRRNNSAFVRTSSSTRHLQQHPTTHRARKSLRPISMSPTSFTHLAVT